MSVMHRVEQTALKEVRLDHSPALARAYPFPCSSSCVALFTLEASESFGQRERLVGEGPGGHAGRRMRGRLMS